MNVSLTPEFEKFVSDQVATGRYASASEVVREALRMLEERHRGLMGDESIREEQLAAFRAELDRRLAAMDRGELISAEESRRLLKQHTDEWRRKRA